MGGGLRVHYRPRYAIGYVIYYTSVSLPLALRTLHSMPVLLPSQPPLHDPALATPYPVTHLPPPQLYHTSVSVPLVLLTFLSIPVHSSPSSLPYMTQPRHSLSRDPSTPPSPLVVSCRRVVFPSRPSVVQGSPPPVGIN